MKRSKDQKMINSNCSRQKREQTRDFPRQNVKRKRISSPQVVYDEEDGHLIINPKTILDNRYIVIGLIGKGTFGKVVEAFDKELKLFCAIKIIKSIKKYTDAAKVEINMLTFLKNLDPDNR
jgi:serine/threonine protein kinase